MIETIEEKLPVGPDKWRVVACVHHERNGWPLREYSSLRKKFQKLVKASSNLPTGESDIPESLSEARRVHRLLRSSCKAADPSNENGGALAIMGEVAAFNGLPAVSSDQVTDPLSEEEDMSSIATGSVRLDGPKNLTTKRSSSLSSSSSKAANPVMKTIEALLTQQASQQVEERRHREEERREEARRREEDRAFESRLQRRQNKQWMQLCLLGIGAVQSTRASGEDGTPNLMEQLVSSIGKDDSDEEERPSKRGRSSD
jgi:hypothetical protein